MNGVGLVALGVAAFIAWCGVQVARANAEYARTHDDEGNEGFIDYTDRALAIVADRPAFVDDNPRPEFVSELRERVVNELDARRAKRDHR